MSTIYRCAECEQYYCAECDGGQDSCETCHIGPYCDDCAAEHSKECSEPVPDIDVYLHDARMCPECGCGSDHDNDDDQGSCTADCAGWYWQSCFPGCLPDSEPHGPFYTEDEALADAREGMSDDDDDDDDDVGGEEHCEYPHDPGYLPGCPACDSSCHCGPGVGEGRETECCWRGHEVSEVGE